MAQESAVAEPRADRPVARVGAPHVPAHEEPRVQAIEAEVMVRRGELTGLVEELKWRLRPERHLVGIAVTVVGMAAGVAAVVAMRRRRARREASLLARGRRIKAAVGRLVEHPERVAVQPTTGQRVLESAASAAAAYVINAALERLGRSFRSV